jgi:hypothetical protein
MRSAHGFSSEAGVALVPQIRIHPKLCNLQTFPKRREEIPLLKRLGQKQKPLVGRQMLELSIQLLEVSQ